MAATPAQRNQIAIAFGAVLRAARTRSGLSQEALGLACDIDRTYVSLLERGERQPTLSTLFVLSEHLGVTPESLVVQTGKAVRR
ncbi:MULTISPECIES: helix-turn-helix domain-containing protein [Hydrocarboniphaga]|jgi:transcriptional regulator with XRE-family HTH domain|uniref:helix-turn-helix domain-containing protein n=1 Tax=Hydrocarboniphaga TaxID=243627 RepID=UPI0005916B43|nr:MULTISPECIES: helix-turn-helix transcriptional regulator [Hydrocarboniphaga]MDZ4079789.1 helix-turn-helix transcriptional regulator [Hydrocarboniphaga sp.]